MNLTKKFLSHPFIKGMTRIIEPFCGHDYPELSRPKKSVWETIGEDFNKIGEDIRTAMKKFGGENNKKEAP